MRYIKYTQVDYVTGIPVTVSPASNGPASPDILGLEFGFALESQYPTLTPAYYGTAPDASDIDIPGVLDEMTEAEYQVAHDAEIKARADKLVPKSCTRRQGLLALLSYGIKRSEIETQIETIEDEMEREAAWIEYLADTWELGNPRLQAMWAALGGTAEQLPDLFRLAVTL